MSELAAMWPHMLVIRMLTIAVKWANELSIGDAIVGTGTLLLAFFTWRLARASYALDKRTTAREQERREREIRGVARLV